MNHALNRLVIRLGMLGVAVASGALAVSQAQKGLQTAATDPDHQASADIDSVSTASTLGASAASQASLPAPIPLQPSDENVYATQGGGSAGYSNEVPGFAADSGQSHPSVYDQPAEPATLPPPLENSNLSHSVPAIAYDLPPAPPAASGHSAEGMPAAVSEGHYGTIQAVQAEMPGDATDAPAEPVASSYPDIHDGGEPAVEPPGPLPASTRQAVDVESTPSVPPAASPPESGASAFSPPPEQTGDPFAPTTAAPADGTYQGDAIFHMPDQPAHDAERNGRPHEDLFGATPPLNTVPPTSQDVAMEEPAETGNGQPGPEELIGPQTPSLTIRKTAPTEAQVGKPTRLETVVRNVGKIAAHDVLIRDEVPRGTRLIDTTPAAGATADGGILWQIGTIEPNAEVTVSMNVMPLEEGEIGSVATISFQVAATARSVVTRPVLLLEHSGPQQVLVGRDVVFQIRLANTGTGVATNVHLEEDVPEGLRHFDGRELEFRIGTLKPGESRMLELKLTADKPGIVTNTLVARGDSKLRVKDDFEFEVVAPQLQLAVDGPHKRFLDRKAAYQISIANPGTAPAQNVELVAKLPPSLKFVSANNAGHYDSSRHVVVWGLESLPPQEMGTVELTLLPVQMGRFPLRVDAKANMNLADMVNYDVEIEGMAALLYTVTDVNDPIEVGGDTTYEIQVINQGSKASTNLQLAAIVPSGMELVRGDGPARGTIDGARILFDPLPRLAPHGDVVYRIQVRGTEPGDKRIQVKLKSDDLSEPVTKEESTHVYSDE